MFRLPTFSLLAVPTAVFSLACSPAEGSRNHANSDSSASSTSNASTPAINPNAATTPGEGSTQSEAQSADQSATASTSSKPLSANQYRLTDADRARTPNELGRIPIVEYHLIGDKNARYERQYDQFRKDLQLMYDRGYRPVTIGQVLDRKIDLPKGLSPVVVVFDDASPGQFSYIEQNGELKIAPNSAVGILLEFNRKNPDWTNSAVFCMLPGAAAGRSFFGDKGIEGQKTEWRFKKVQFLAEKGFELCNHTLWHANLSKYSDNIVQEQIARGNLAIDSAVPGYKVRTFALPLGVWPKNRELAWQGSWTDPKTGKTTRYKNDAVLEVSGGPTRSPYDPKFNPHSMNRIEVFGDELTKVLDQLDRPGPNSRYVSDGDPNTIAKP